jgi:hypothetical protein
MACPQVADGKDTLQLWRVAANILNKQLQTHNKGWSSSLGVGLLTDIQNRTRTWTDSSDEQPKQKKMDIKLVLES